MTRTVRGTVLRKSRESCDEEIEIHFIAKVADSWIVNLLWPKGKRFKSLKRLSHFTWTRKDAFGYIRTKQGKLYKIDGMDAFGIHGPVTRVYLVASHRERKEASG